MTHTPRRRLLATAATSVALSLTTALHAQMQSPLAATPDQIAALSLPDAPQPQTSTSPEPPPAPSSPASEQQTPATPPDAAPAPTPAELREQQRRQAELDVQKEEKQRLLGVMPQFQTVVGGKAVPLTASQKWTLASRSAIDPFYIAYAFVIGGGYGELVDSHTGYHHGAAGYFKRVGSNYADNIDGALIGNGLLPIILHQDPRYFRLGTGSFGRRFLHAAASTVICKGDNGKSQPNISNVLGNFISGAISNAYYPADERGVDLTLENGLEVTALGAVGGQLLEFGPDLNRIILHGGRKRMARKAAAAAAAQSAGSQSTANQPAGTQTTSPPPPR